MVALLTALINRYKAASPTDPEVYWISLKPKAIALKFLSESGYKVSHGFVKRLLKQLGFRYRKLSKNLSTGSYAQRDRQFQIIFTFLLMMSLKTPILSIDCKKKERLGNLYRTGKAYSTAPINVYDHDYPYLSKGKVIPFGIYDLLRNEAFISIGNSHETAKFIKDNLLWWWDEFGIHQYPDTDTIFILCDAGGANSYRHHAFKKQLLELAQEIGKDIIICHYPPYASKWNPIEHRVFCHLHQSMEGIILTDYELVKELFNNTTTQNGLKVYARLNLKKYQIGLKTTKQELDFNRIDFNNQIPKLSYRIAA